MEHRENVSYAVGDPYSVFDYVPHTLLPDGSVRLSPDAIEQMWRKTHDWEPLPNWRRQAQASEPAPQNHLDEIAARPWDWDKVKGWSDPGPALSPLARPAARYRNRGGSSEIYSPYDTTDTSEEGQQQ